AFLSARGRVRERAAEDPKRQDPAVFAQEGGGGEAEGVKPQCFGNCSTSRSRIPRCMKISNAFLAASLSRAQGSVPINCSSGGNVCGVSSEDVLVEEYIEGREIYVALLGNGEPEVLPLIELDFGDRETRLVTWEDKQHMAVAAPQTICPARIDSKLATALRDISVATFRACQCRDYARVDLRID
ncbi:hypothetical protein EN795_34645, partial [bacterium M00.F.Ca.ET.152.01.1.1]